MFSRRKLIRDGTLDLKKFQIASYDDWGHLIEIKSTASAYAPKYACEGIHRSVVNNKFYKDRLFKKYKLNEEVPEEIEVPTCCIIDDTPFRNMTEAAKYLGVSR